MSATPFMFWQKGKFNKVRIQMKEYMNILKNCHYKQLTILNDGKKRKKKKRLLL